MKVPQFVLNCSLLAGTLSVSGVCPGGCHSFSSAALEPAGLFNVGNKLLVSLDLLFAIRNQIKLGEDPRVSISALLQSVQEQTGTGWRPPRPEARPEPPGLHGSSGLEGC